MKLSDEVEKLLGFKTRDGMVLVDYNDTESQMPTKGWSVPRTKDMKKAVEVIEQLLSDRRLLDANGGERNKTIDECLAKVEKYCDASILASFSHANATVTSATIAACQTIADELRQLKTQ